MSMSQGELNDPIDELLVQGVPRPDIVKEVEQIGLEGDPWADCERMVAEFPERRAEGPNKSFLPDMLFARN